MRRKVCVVTGTRAEYGLLRWVMEGLRRREETELQVIATGMHLSPEFGLTYREIERDGFAIDRKIEMLLSSDTPVGLAKSMALGLAGFADAFAELRPEVLVLLGDRFEVFSAAAAAMVARVPIAHIHGGEATEGLIDEAIRHAITKMAHLHFVAAEAYGRRVVQLGEQPHNVHVVGGLGVDVIARTVLLDREALEASLDFRLGERNLLVTFHPLTLEHGASQEQMGALLSALEEFPDIHLVFTMPNADTDGRVLLDQVRRFVSGRKNSCAFTSLGQVRYLSCLRYVDGVVGNSSSGLTEAPSFRCATVNIGDRQRGRLKAESVIDCLPEKGAITEAIRTIYTDPVRRTVASTKNPYGEAGSSERIVEVLATRPLDGILKKSFYDLTP